MIVFSQEFRFPNNIHVIEVLARYGSPAQQKKWLYPLLNGEIRSAFAMTEKNGMLHLFFFLVQMSPNILYEVASSDATNICTSIRQEGNEIVINGHKWYGMSCLYSMNDFLSVLLFKVDQWRRRPTNKGPSRDGQERP